MTEGKRPGGLTALAVINFIWGGINVLILLGLVAVVLILTKGADSGDAKMAEAQQKIAEAWDKIGRGVLYAMVGFAVVNVTLLISSGIGYLKQKKVMGRGLGTAWALLSIASTGVEMMLVSDEARGGGAGLGVLIAIVYPVLTLILLNTTFKHDFIR